MISENTRRARSCYLAIFLILVAASTLMILWTPVGSVTKFMAIITPNITALKNLALLDESSPNVRQDVAESLKEISRNVQVEGIDCPAIFEGSKNETERAKSKATKIGTPFPDNYYLKATVDCAEFQRQRGYIMSSLTEEEEEFPLAFSMIVYKEAEMVERLLRAVYRPQNVYCIHVDQKSSAEFYKAVSAIANCFTNVFMTSYRIRVIWGQMTVLEPELLCMEELWRYPKWKYFINLTGQEFPLKTNYEIVKILTAYNGAVDVVSTVKQ